MNIAAVNKYLSIAANLSVLAGILFLAMEIQQNSEIAKTSEYRENTQALADWMTTLTTNPELDKNFYLYRQGNHHDLSEDAKRNIQMMVSIVAGIYENAYFAMQNGIMNEEGWERFHLGACAHYHSSKGSGILFGIITDNFTEYLDTTCDSYNSARAT